MSESTTRARLALAGVLLLCAAACTTSSDLVTAVTGTIRGTVTDVETGSLLPGASVRFGESTALSGADGTYLLLAVPQGGLTLNVARSGYWNYSGWVVFNAANGVLVRDIALTPIPASSSGSASDSSLARPDGAESMRRAETSEGTPASKSR